MSMLAMLGLKGTGDSVTDQRPKNWREAIMYLEPNGMAPLTALLSAAKSESVDDPEFNWWDQTFEAAKGTITGTYLNSGLSTAYTATGGGTAGTTVYVKMAEADAALVNAGHTILARNVADYKMDILLKVMATPTLNGSSSYLQCVLLEDDDNGTATSTSNLSDATVFIVAGSAFSEGASMPPSVSYKPVKQSNWTQIFRTSLEITRTMEQTRMRTRPAEYQRLKAEAMKRHSMEMEQAFWWGVPLETTTANYFISGQDATGKPLRMTKGLVNWIKGNTYAATNNICDYTNDTHLSSLGVPGAGKDWTATGGGLDWLNAMLERIFRYGSSERVAFCGSQALLGIQRLVQAHAQYNITGRENRYGMKIVEWDTPFGSIYLKTHPMWNGDTSGYAKAIVMIEPTNLTYRYIQDTKFFPDTNGNNAGVRRTDAKYEEWLTECGLEMHHPETCGILYGVGDNNAA